MNDTRASAAQIAVVVENLTRLFILHPGDLVVRHHYQPGEMYLRIDAHAGDIGRIIGTKGAHIKALQSVVRIAAARAGMRGTIKPLATDGIGKPDRYPAFKPRLDWPRDDIMAALADVLNLTLIEPQTHRLDFLDNNQDGETAITIRCSSLNRPHLTELDHAINVLLNSAGKANGRTLATLLTCN